jgi:hypothetical protein
MVSQCSQKYRVGRFDGAKMVKRGCYLVCLIIYCLRPAQEYFTYMPGDVTIAGEGLQNLGLCSALRAFVYRATPTLTRDLGFSVSSEGPPHSVASYDTHGGVEDLL